MQIGKVSGAQGHAGAGDSLEGTAAAGPGFVRLHTGIKWIPQWTFCREDNTDALNAAIGVEQFGLHDGDVGTAQRFDQRWEPVRRNGGVVVKEDDDGALAGGKAQVAAQCEVEVFGVTQQPQIVVFAGQTLQHDLGGGVASVIDKDEFEALGGSVPVERCNAGSSQFRLVVDGDDDGNQLILAQLASLGRPIDEIKRLSYSLACVGLVDKLTGGRRQRFDNLQRGCIGEVVRPGEQADLAAAEVWDKAEDTFEGVFELTVSGVVAATRG